MIKNSKKTIFALLVASLLGGALWGIKFLPDKKSIDTNINNDNNINIISQSFENIKNINVKNQYGEYIISKNKSKNLYIKELENYPRQDSKYHEIADIITTFSANMVVDESPSDLSIYGLNKPSAEINIQFNEKSYKLLIGNLAPSDLGYYFKVENQPKIYIASTDNITPLLDSKLSYISLELTSTESTDVNMKNLEYITLEGANRIKPIKIVPNLSADSKNDINNNINYGSYNIIEPINKNVSTDTGTEIINALENMYGQKIEILNPTLDDIKNCGLDTPFATVTIKLKNKKPIVIIASPIGNTEDYFVMKQTSNIIYRSSKSAISWVDASLNDLVSKVICAPTIENLNQLCIESNNLNYKFNINHKNEDINVKYNNKILSVDNFRKYFIFLSSLSVDNYLYALEKPQAADILTIKYNYKKSNSPSVIHILPSENSDDTVLVFLNDISCGEMSKEIVDIILLNSQRIANNEDILD